MPIPYLQILVLLACAVFFYRAAETSEESALIWCGLSLSISTLTLFWLHWGWFGVLSGQFALFVGITVFRMNRKK